MKIVFDDRQYLHQGAAEFTGGQMRPCFESPKRIESIVNALRNNGFQSPVAPQDHGLEPILRVHDPAFIAFLHSAWARWVSKFGQRDALPWNWPTRTMLSFSKPDTIEGQMAYYAIDAGAPITANTWDSAYWSVQSALEAAATVAKGRHAFALCRPPGHHAAADCYGAYCFMNNVAIAAQYLRDHGMNRVAVLDVDYHHGNGTQSIFYARNDVLTVSLHGDPKTVFPYFSGHHNEIGKSEGAGFNLNLPLANGTKGSTWLKTLEAALRRVENEKPEALVVALGLDTAKGDPVSTFQLELEDYSHIGKMLASLNLPTLFVLEGGYALDLVGVCAANVVKQFER
jgi:acetoin utilization deacetylase AcuC-like enzyme